MLLRNTVTNLLKNPSVSGDLCPVLSGGRDDFNCDPPAAGVDVTQQTVRAASPSPGTNASFDLSCLETPILRSSSLEPLSSPSPCQGSSVALSQALSNQCCVELEPSRPGGRKPPLPPTQ